MHSLADCPLRTYCTITTTDSYPFTILGLDQDALDLFVTSSSCALDPLPPSSLKDCAILSQRRARLDLFLRGKSILDFLLSDHDSFFLSSSSSPSLSTSLSLSSLAPSATESAAAAESESTCPREHLSRAIQPFLVSLPPDDTVSGSTRAFPTSSRYPPPPQKRHRRVHGCIHRSVVCSLPADQRVPGSKETNQSCRVYVLKDVTRIHDLAVAARTDLSSRQPSSSSSPPASSPLLKQSSCPPVSRNATRPKGALVIGHHSQPKLYPSPACSSVVSPPPRQQTKQQQQQQQPLVPHSSSLPHRVDLHYSSNGHTSTSTKQDTRSPLPPGTAARPPHQNSGLLLMLQVTRFGTIDHAFTVLPASPTAPSSECPSLFLGQDRAAMEALTNCSIMSCVHPQDLRPLCQGLDRVCKALYTQFRVRWRVARMAQPLEDKVVSADITAPKSSHSSSDALLSLRKIEFQGEIFEEWIDPTRMESCGRVLPEPQQSEEFAWIEIKGILSEGQPMLVLRPLNTQELTLLQEEEEASMSATMSRSELHQMVEANDTDNDVEEERGCESAKELWRTKSRRMGLEEGLMFPRQLNLSALTTLSLEERSSRMPGSLPPSAVNTITNAIGGNHTYSQVSVSSSSRCYSTGSHHARTSGHWMAMPAAMAFPLPSSPPWTIVMTVALDAWKEWIQTVHVGQAQFQDWCEYVLVMTLDQVIESVSLGLTLLGIESTQSLTTTSSSTTNTIADTSMARLTELTEESSESESESEDLVRQAAPQQPRQQQQYILETEDQEQDQQSLSGLDRVGKILEGYPSIDGYVRQIGGTWLGKMVKSRLEHKLERVAGQVVTWWDMSSALSSSLSSSTFTVAGISNVTNHGNGSLGVSSVEGRIVQ